MQTRTPSSVRGQLKGIQFLDASNGFAVGEGGVLLRTVDGGAEWTLAATVTTSDGSGQPTMTPAVLHELHFFDTQRGYVVGDDLTIAYTDDGGLSWSYELFGDLPASLDPSDPQDAYDLHFWSEDEGVIALDEGWVIKKEPGAPVPWVHIHLTGTPICFPELTNLEFWSIDFLGDVGFLSGGIGNNDGLVFHSSDRGRTWRREDCFTPVDPPNPAAANPDCVLTKPTLYGVAAMGPAIDGNERAFAVGYGSTIWERRAPDVSGPCGDANPTPFWERTSTPHPWANPPLNWVHRIDDDRWFVSGTFGRIERFTVDPPTGDVLRESLLSTEALRVTRSAFSDVGIGFQVGQAARVLRIAYDAASDTTSVEQTYGTSAVTDPGDEYIYGIDCTADGLIVIAVGTEGVRYSTSSGDPGTWVAGTDALGNPLPASLTDVVLDDSGTRAYAFGAGGTVFSSIDGGATWRPKPQVPVSNPIASHFADPLTGIVVGKLGQAARTSDGGASWTSLSAVTPSGQPFGQELRGVLTVGTAAYVVGAGGGVFWSADVTSSQVLTGIDTGLAVQAGARLNDVDMDATGALYVGGDHGVVLRFQSGVWTDPRPMTKFNIVGVDATADGVFVSSRRNGLARF